jgi:hypothetical protein
VQASEQVRASLRRRNQLWVAVRENELNVGFAKRRIDGDDNRTEIDASKIKDCELAAIGKHDGNAVAFLHALPAQLERESTGETMKFPVGNLAAGGGIDKKNILLSTVNYLDDHFANGHCTASGVD